MAFHLVTQHQKKKKRRIGFANYNLAQLLWNITDVVRYRYTLWHLAVD